MLTPGSKGWLNVRVSVRVNHTVSHTCLRLQSMEGWSRPGREEAGLIKHTAWVKCGRPGEDWQLLLLSDPHWAPLQWEVSHWEGTLLNNWFMDLIEFVSSWHTEITACLLVCQTFFVPPSGSLRATGIMMYIHLPLYSLYISWQRGVSKSSLWLWGDTGYSQGWLSYGCIYPQDWSANSSRPCVEVMWN